jgi:SAM-dependent methyltransferase
MAHAQQLMFFSIISQQVVKKKKGVKVLEVGSYDVTGSVRQFFEGVDYTGCDLIAGPGVDVVSSGHDLAHATNSYEITLSSECFEHNPYWLETFQNMWRMTKPGGLVVMTCASRGRAEHGTERTTDLVSVSPGTSAIGWNYYKNLNQSDFEKNIDLKSLFDKYFFYYMPTSSDLYFCGQKLGDAIFDLNISNLKSRMAEIKAIPSYQNISKVKLILMKVHSFPILIMSYLLDDVSFQNWRINYLRAFRPFTKLIKKILG